MVCAEDSWWTVVTEAWTSLNCDVVWGISRLRDKGGKLLSSARDSLDSTRVMRLELGNLQSQAAWLSGAGPGPGVWGPTADGPGEAW